MDWSDCQKDLWATAIALDRVAHLYKKNPLVSVKEKSDMAKELADKCRRLAERRLTVPLGLESLPHDEVLIRLYRLIKVEASVFLPEE